MKFKEEQARYVKQYVSGILDYSSQYGSENARSFSYSISNVVGEPKIFPKYGDYTQAAVMRTYGRWWDGDVIDDLMCKDTRPQSSNFRSDDYIDLIFEQAVYPWSIAIYETYNPGGLVRILAMCEQFPDLPQTSNNNETNEDSTNLDLHKRLIPMPPYGCSRWEVLWESSESGCHNKSGRGARMFAPILHELDHQTRIIRLEFCHSNLDYYTEIDAVELTGTLHFYRSSSVDPPLHQPQPSIQQMTDEDVSESKVDLQLLQPPNPNSPQPLNFTEEKTTSQLSLHNNNSGSGDVIITNDVTQHDDVTTTQHDDVITTQHDDVITSTTYGYFSFLPCEIMDKIFGYLPLPALLRTSKVCRLFRDHSYQQRHLVRVDLQPYWHLADVHLLESLSARFPHDGVREHSSEVEIIEEDDKNKKNKSMEWLKFSWLGGGETITSDQFTTFLSITQLSMLRHLDVTSSPCVSDESLKLMVECTPLLRHLNIQSCDKPTSEGIRILGDLKFLKYLNLYRTQADDAGVICLIQNNSDLENINLGSCLKISDFNRIFEEIGKNCRKMKTIDVWRAKTLTSQGIEDLLRGCRKIQRLDLGWCIGLTSNSGSFDRLAQSCPNLTKLFLTANRTLCDVDVLKIADFCPKLELLDILGTRLVTRPTIEYLLTKCDKLKFLDLSFCYSFGADVIGSLRANHPHVSIKRSFQD